MAKYSSEEKLHSVLRYLSGKESSYDIAKSIGTDHKSILKWVKQYEYNGIDAFIKSYTNYSTQFKLDVLNHMIEHGTSSLETAAIFNIAAPTTVMKWMNLFRKYGSDALQSKRGVYP